MAGARGVYLPSAVWTALEKCAAATGSFPARGKNAGRRPSVDALIRRIGESPVLVEKITQFLNSPVAQAETGLPSIIIRPEKFVSRTIARIGISQAAITVNFPEKRDDFREIVKGMDYTWDGQEWVKSVDGWGKAANAGAELGHRLLAGGFWIAPPTSEVQNLIVEESFEPEHRRKVMVRSKGKYSGWLVLWWSRSEDCYSAAKRITVNYYDKPDVVVPPEYYDEVEDFATRYNFYITPAARRVLDQAKAALNAALLVQIEAEEPEAAPAYDGKPGRLAMPESVEIDHELADHD